MEEKGHDVCKSSGCVVNLKDRWFQGNLHYFIGGNKWVHWGRGVEDSVLLLKCIWVSFKYYHYIRVWSVLPLSADAVQAACYFLWKLSLITCVWNDYYSRHTGPSWCGCILVMFRQKTAWSVLQNIMDWVTLTTIRCNVSDTVVFWFNVDTYMSCRNHPAIHGLYSFYTTSPDVLLCCCNNDFGH